MANFESASHKEIIESVHKNISTLNNEIIPMLKHKKAFSLAQMEMVAGVFFNSGACLNYLVGVTNCRTASKQEKTEAHVLCYNLENLCEEALDLMNDK